MVLVPSYIEIDRLVVPLLVSPADRHGPDVVRVSFERPPLEGFAFVASAMLARPPAEPWLATIERHEKLPLPDQLAAVPVEHLEYDYSEHAKLWRRLTGTDIDLSDAYNIGTSFVRGNLAIPRTTFHKIMARLFELDAALRAGELEPAIDTSVPVPPVPPEPEEPTGTWDDLEWIDMEERAQHLDEVDPLTAATDSVDHAREVWAHRRSLLDRLSIAWDRTRCGHDDLPGRVRALELPTLTAYVEATDALVAYLASPERRAVITSPPAASPYLEAVSVDLFRLPPAPGPAGLPRHAWIAACEAYFVARRPDPSGYVGELITRLHGHYARMRFRREAAHSLTLWRIELV